MFHLIRIVGFTFIGHILETMGYSVATKQWWCIMLTVLVLCLACGIEHLYE